MASIPSTTNTLYSIEEALLKMNETHIALEHHFLSVYGPQDNPSTPVDPKALEVFQQVFNDKASPVTPEIRKIIAQYIPDETTMIAYKSQLYPDHCVSPFKAVELFSRAILKQLFDKNCRSEEHLSSATILAKSIYEQGYRQVSSLKFGFVCPMNPEVLAYMMRIVQSLPHKNIQVMELGAADGKNAILLAYTKATKVFVNDQCTKEKALFRKHVAMLPSNVRKKLQFIDKDCLKILRKRKDLEGTMDLVFSRNLFHFFSKREQKKYMELTHKLLKKDGLAVISVDAPYPFFRKHKNIFEKHPKHNCFYLTSCLVVDAVKDNAYSIFDKIEYCPESAFSLASFEEYNFLLRSRKTNFRWKYNQEEFERMDRDLQGKVREAYDREKKKIDKIQRGCVNVMIHKVHCFTQETLISLFNRNHFKVITTAVLGNDGHLVEDDLIEEQGRQVVIVVQKIQ